MAIPTFAEAHIVADSAPEALDPAADLDAKMLPPAFIRPTRGFASFGGVVTALSALSPRLAILLSALMLAAVGYLDYVTGVDVSVLPFYLVPLCLAAWRGPRWAWFVFAIGATVVWEISNRAAGRVDSSVALTWWNMTAVLSGYLLVGWLINLLRAQLSRARELSLTDSLTGLQNLRAFRATLYDLITLSHRSTLPLTVAYLDLDHFKDVNDSLGHAAGDAMLKAVAQALNASVRDSDVVARLGGDEFAIVLVNAQRAHASHVLAELHLRLNGLLRTFHDRASASIGAVHCARAPQSVDALIAYADQIMYEAKSTERGCMRMLDLEGAGGA